MHGLHDCLKLPAGAALSRMLDAVQATCCIMSAGVHLRSLTWGVHTVSRITMDWPQWAAVCLGPQLSIGINALKLYDNACCIAFCGSHFA